MKETDFNEAQESKEENIDVKELLFKYLIHWPWFVGAVVACLIANHYFKIFTNRLTMDTKIEVAENQRLVLLPTSEFRAFALLGVT